MSIALGIILRQQILSRGGATKLGALLSTGIKKQVRNSALSLPICIIPNPSQLAFIAASSSDSPELKATAF